MDCVMSCDTLCILHICEVVALATKFSILQRVPPALSTTNAEVLRRTGSCIAILGDVSRTFPSRYIPYGNERIKGDDVTAINPCLIGEYDSDCGFVILPLVRGEP